jgi:hypothetical protein
LFIREKSRRGNVFDLYAGSTHNNGLPGGVLEERKNILANLTDYPFGSSSLGNNRVSNIWPGGRGADDLHAVSGLIHALE